MNSAFRWGDDLVSRWRDHTFDGLRGLMALVVVLHHALAVHPAIATAVLAPGSDIPTWTWVFSYTPFRLLHDGQTAVIVFFVLSGVVLVRGMAEADARGWLAYYPRRVIRLYAPTTAALLLGAVLLTLWVPRSVEGGSDWIHLHTGVDPRASLLHDAVLLDGVRSPALITALWSLKWEVLFSLALPVYVWAARRLSTHAIATGVVLVALVGVGEATGWLWCRLLPAFGMGALLAVRRASVRTFVRRLAGSTWGWRAALAAVVALLSGHAASQGAIATGVNAALARPLGAMAQVAGATALVGIVSARPRTRRVMQSAPVRSLATWSFSLYLVHEPVLVAFASQADSVPGAVALMPVAVVASFLVAAAFTVLVEAPSHALSRRAGEVVSSSFRRRLRWPAPAS